MSTQKKAAAAQAGGCTQKAVAEYLRNHPDFFQTHEALLAELHLPHRCGAAVSLVERQISLLREHNAQLRRKLMDLVQVARDNDRIGERMQRLTLALLDAVSLEDVVIAVHDVMRTEFASDAVAMRLFRPAAGEPPALASPDVFVARDEPALAGFATLFKTGRPLCGRLKPAQARYLFAGEPELGSAVVMPLREQRELGLLAIGSRDVERFQTGMGTAFVARMAELVSHALRPHLAS
jgi:uncharacterized protein